MLSTTPTDNDLIQSQLCIVCSQNHSLAIRQEISRQSHHYWEQQGAVHVVAVPADRLRDASNVTAQVNALARKCPSLTVISLSPALVNGARLRQNISFDINQPQSVRAFKTRFLPKELLRLNLDIVGITLRNLHNAWDHGKITRNHIEEWIGQFDQAGGHKWIGNGLLTVLDFWSRTRIIQHLRLKDDSANFDYVCVNANPDRLGSSASALSSVINKQLGVKPQIRLRDLHTTIEESEVDSVLDILVIEDCLLTGNETVRVLSGLLGMTDRYGRPRTKPLSNPDTLKRHKIKLRFCVGTNCGIITITEFLNTHSLNRIEIDIVESAIIQTLTSDGERALKAGCLFDQEDCLSDPDSYMLRPAFVPLEIWVSPERRQRAISFCRNIGQQLYAFYLAQKGKDASSRFVDDCALGVQSHGLALGFAHSIPKATLPIFWMGGPITFEGKTIDWIPLFPNAAA